MSCIGHIKCLLYTRSKGLAIHTMEYKIINGMPLLGQ